MSALVETFIKPLKPFTSLILSCSLSLLPLSVQAWQLEPTDEESSVKVWTQEVAGSDFKAFKAVVTIQAPIREIMLEIKDTAKMHEWYYNTLLAKRLYKIAEKQWLTYSVTSAPWPVSDRDSVTKVTENILENGFLLEMQAMPHAYPLQQDRIRIPKMTGYWKIIELQANLTEVTLEIAAEPGGEIPSWLANTMVVEMPFYSLENLKQRIEQR